MRAADGIAVYISLDLVARFYLLDQSPIVPVSTFC